MRRRLAVRYRLASDERELHPARKKSCRKPRLEADMDQNVLVPDLVVAGL